MKISLLPKPHHQPPPTITNTVTAHQSRTIHAIALLRCPIAWVPLLAAACINVEYANSSRAKCVGPICTKEGNKILKGEIRFGTFVDTGTFASFKWRHWYLLFFTMASETWSLLFCLPRCLL